MAKKSVELEPRSSYGAYVIGSVRYLDVLRTRHRFGLNIY